ncbi:MAG TPA: RDD family protein, partial [Polyangiaceae bacterium]|nr:RDD family protein [Polyangiaceae bacterium]
HVVFHALFGQTLGKMAAGIRVVRVSGERIGWREASFRSSVDIGFGVLGAIVTGQALLHFPAAEWSASSLENSKRLLELQPPWARLEPYVSSLWYWSELFVLLTNRRRRALHDFIAGTVVVRSVVAQEDVEDDAGDEFAGEAVPAAPLELTTATLFVCPECRAMVNFGASECRECGQRFRYQKGAVFPTESR